MDKLKRKSKKQALFLIVSAVIIIATSLIVMVITQSKNKTLFAKEYTGPYIDTHAHLLLDDYPIAKLNADLKEYKFEKMILMSPPVDLSNSMSDKEYGIEEAQKHTQLKTFYQGEGIRLLHEMIEQGKASDLETTRFIKLIEEAAQSGKYIGFGEIALRHLPQPGLNDQQKQARDITIDGAHPLMNILAELAGKYKMPLDIHMEPNSATLPGFERLVRQNPNTKFILDHAGWYNTGEATPELFDRLLGRYSNLYSNIKIRKPTSPAQKQVAMLNESGKIDDKWGKVLVKYSDRFMIGSDLKFGLATEEGDVSTLGKYKDLLKQLPYETAQKIAVLNAKEIFKLD